MTCFNKTKITQLQLVYSYHLSNIPFSVKKRFFCYIKNPFKRDISCRFSHPRSFTDNLRTTGAFPVVASLLLRRLFYLLNFVKLQTYVALTSSIDKIDILTRLGEHTRLDYHNSLQLWLHMSSRGGTGYAGSLLGNSIKFRGNTLTPVTSYISLR